ncbi:MAG: hypothetical protein U0838_05325 [Chloroflexota bacterium]
MPLTVQNATTGVLTFLRRTDDPFDPGELFVAEELGRRAGRALENALLLGEVERFADLDRRRAAELEAILGAVEEGFLVADATGAVRSSNRAAERLLGGPVETLDDLLTSFVDAAGRSPREPPDPASGASPAATGQRLGRDCELPRGSAVGHRRPVDRRGGARRDRVPPRAGAPERPSWACCRTSCERR